MNIYQMQAKERITLTREAQAIVTVADALDKVTQAQLKINEILEQLGADIGTGIVVESVTSFDFGRDSTIVTLKAVITP